MCDDIESPGQIDLRGHVRFEVVEARHATEMSDVRDSATRHIIQTKYDRALIK